VSALPFENVARPGPWRARGACTVVPTEMFFPERGVSLEPAKAVCGACPVSAQCREYALGVAELKGVWGGLGERERRRLRAQRRAAADSGPSRTALGRARPPTRPANEPLYRVLAALSASPGLWARVAWYPDAEGAAAMAACLRGGSVAVPEGRWHFESRSSGDDGSSLFAYYAEASPVGAAPGDIASES
jgi:WhiB family redox-sensing transcriptional regulator